MNQADLDEFMRALADTDEAALGERRLRPCLDLTLFSDIELTESAKDISHFLEVVYPLLNAQPSYFLTKDMSMAKAISGTPSEQVETVLKDKKLLASPLFSLEQHSGHSARDFSPPSITVMSERERTGAKKFREHVILRVCLHPQDVKTAMRIAEAALELFPLFAGYCGYSYYYAAGDIDCMRLVEKNNKYWLTRFPGLQHGEPTELSMYGTEGVLRVGWLTLLGKTCTDAFGSAEELRKALGPGIDLVESDRQGHWLIKAGSAPTLGDRNRGQQLPLQRLVAKALAELRVSGERVSEIPITGLDDEDKQAWIDEQFGSE